MYKSAIVLLSILFVLITGDLSFAEDLYIRAESPQAVEGEIDGSQDFQVDLVMDYVGSEDMSGLEFGIYFSSPDNTLENVIHRDVGGYGPLNSITYSQEWLNIFSIFNQVNLGLEYGFNGTLPDSVYHTFIGLYGYSPGQGEQTQITYHMAAEAAVGGVGTLCVDSAGQGENPDFDWLFPLDIEAHFDGPYCWQIYNLESTGEPPTIICPDDASLTCGQQTDPDWTGYATATDDIDPDPEITYSDEFSSPECPTVITRTWRATDNEGFFSTCVQTIIIGARPKYHVSPSGSDVDGDGSEGAPFMTISKALEFAVDNDSILVHPGVYTENIEVNNFAVYVYGIGGAGMTWINSEATGIPAVAFRNIDQPGGGLTGITINGTSGAPGLVVEHSAPIIEECNIVNNNNGGSTAGGGIMINESAVRISNNRIHNNSSDEGGGGIAVFGTAEVEISHNEIYENDAPVGAGIAVNSATVQATNVYIHHNLIRNNVVTADFSDGIYINGVNCRVFNNTIVNNKRGIRFVDGYGSIVYNNLITGCVDDGLYPWGAEYDYNDIWNNGGNDNDPGPNGMSLDPLYVNPADNDYTLLLNSPCLNSGNPDPIYNNPDGSRNDIGAFPIELGNLPMALYVNFGEDGQDGVINSLPLHIYWTFFGLEGSTQAQFQIQVGTDNDWETAEMWDSGPVASGAVSVQYEGLELQDNTSYYLRMRVSDGSTWGDWSFAAFEINIIRTYYIPDDFGAIQAAIDASDNLDIIMVRPGTYSENIDFSGKNVYVQSTDGPNATILIPSLTEKSTIEFNNAEDEEACFSGFTVTSGGSANTVWVGNGSSPTIENNIFHDNINFPGSGFSVIAVADGNPLIKRNVFYKNGGENTILVSTSARIINNTLAVNQGGINSATYATLAVNNIIALNSGYGIKGFYSERDFNCVWGNSTDNTAGPNGISENPRLVNPYIGYMKLERLSPCRDAGSPEDQYNDPDGSRNDIGAYYEIPAPPFAENIDYGPDAIGDTIITMPPTVSWDYFDSGGTTQSAYQIQISETIDWSGEPFWDSGPVTSSEAEAVLADPEYQNRYRYFLRIRLDNGSGWGDWLYFTFLTVTDHIIDVPGDFATISEAIDNTFSGDTILVGPGTYTENIVFSQFHDLSIISTDGPNETFLKHPGDNTDPLITMPYGTANGVFEGFDISEVTNGTTIFDLRNDSYSFRAANNFIHSNNVDFVFFSAWGYWIRSEIIRNIVVNSSTDFIFRGSLSQTRIINNTFIGGNKGFDFYIHGGEFYNNIVTGLTGVVYNEIGGSDLWDYNDFWNNASGNLNSGPNGISLDPKFKDPENGDYSLSVDSPCREAGNPDEDYNDIDGTRNDIGAVPYLLNLPVAANIDFGPDADGVIVHSTTPVFNWEYFDTLETTQAQYQIQVGNDDDWSEAEMWDSGPVSSSDNSAEYGGLQLEENDLYYMRIRLSDGTVWGGWIQNRFLIYGGDISVPEHFTTIQEAIDFAPPGCRILVSPGIYEENINFGGKSVIVQSTDGPEVTFLEPNHSSLPIVEFYGGEAVPTALNGFTIRQGGQVETILISASSEVSIENNIFYSNISGVVNPLAVVKNLGIASITRNLFYENGGICCIWCEGMTQIINNTIVENTRGIFSLSNETVIYNNIIVNNDDYAYEHQGGITATIDYNDIWNNSHDISGGPNGLSTNPLFKDPGNRDYRLQIASPCRDAGNPDPAYNDPDGTRNDMGAIPLTLTPPVATNLTYGPDADGNVVFSETPVFGWTYFDTLETTQTQYQIQVGADNDWDVIEYWESGPVASDQNSAVYEGSVLPNAARIYLRIRVHNGTTWGSWSEGWFFINLGFDIYVPGQYATIQAAIEYASDGTNILVAPGIYAENINYLGKNLTIKSTAGAVSTIIRPNNPDMNIVSFASEETRSAVLDGFTVSGTQSAYGIYCNYSSPTIKNCIISECNNPYDGAGIWCDNSNALIANNEIFGNHGQITGGGVAGRGNVGPEIAYNFIHDNIAAHGCGIGFVSGAGDIYIHHNLIVSNVGSGGYAAGIYIDASNSRIHNNTVVENIAGILILGGSNVDIRNNIVVNNENAGIAGSSSIVDYNDVWNNNSGNNPGTNGISLDPEFANPETGDYSLLPASPCIDSGDPDEMYNDIDGTRSDIGAFPMLRILPIAINLSYGPNSIYDTVFVREPEFSWSVLSDPGKTQTAYHIQVGSDNDWSEAELWDSGGIDSPDSSVTYAGTELANNSINYFRIRISDEDGWGDWIERMLVVIIPRVLAVPEEYNSVQAAIQASRIKDTILVAAGTYKENISYLGKNIVVMSDRGAAETVIEAATGNLPVVSINEPVSRSGILEGFTIRGTSGAEGINCDHASPIIRNCIITSCNHDNNGGGIYCDNSNALITNNEIYGNFTSNTGGGIYCRGPVGPEIGYNIIHDNTANQVGGIAMSHNATDIYIHHNLILNNGGTGINFSGLSARIHNNTVVGNNGGLVIMGSSQIDIRNNIVVENTPFGNYYSEATVEYNDFWNNGDGDYYGENSLSVDPVFMSPETGDYTLNPSSPCVDAGDPSNEFNDPDGTRNDMGAFALALEKPYALNISFGQDQSPHLPGSLTPQFNWVYSGDAGTVQDQYQIQVGNDPDWAVVELWDSGPVVSDAGSTVYAGAELMDRVKYYIRIRLNDGSGWGDWVVSWFQTRLSPIINVPEQFMTIQEAIDAAFEGDTILLKPGVYREHIDFMGKQIAVKGISSPSLTEIRAVTDEGPVVNFVEKEGRNSILENLTVNGNDTTTGIQCYRASPTIRGCRIINCSAEDGAGFYLYYSGALITDCEVSDNSSSDNGSALGLIGGSLGVEISHNIFHDNSSGYEAICFLSPYYNETLVDINITHNLFYNNRVLDDRYGEYTIRVNGKNLSIRNNTIVNNNGGIIVYDGEESTVYNNIVVGNSGIGIYGETVDIDYNDAWNNEIANDPGPNGFSLDPEFIDPATNRYGLKHYSPCIDAGSPNEIYNDPDGSRNDMGAYPYGTGPYEEEVIATNEWINLYCTAATLDGEPLSEGDIIKAYDPDGVLCGMDTVGANGDYGFMPVYRDFGSSSVDEGAVPGDHIDIVINNQIVLTGTDIIWEQNGQSYEVCSFSSSTSLEIPLQTGWNLISWNLDTPDDDIEIVCQDVMENVATIQSFENVGLTYDPDLPEFSTLTEVDHYHGFWFNMNGPDNLVIEGDLVAPGTPIELEHGWNLVSYLPNGELPVEDALETVMEHLDIGLGWENGQPLTFDPDLPDYSTMESMHRSLGYWLRVNREMPLVYPGIYGTPDPGQIPAKSFAVGEKEDPDTVSISRYWVDIYGKSLTLSDDKVLPGTIIRAYDDADRLIGKGRVEADGRFGFIPIYGDDPLTEECEGPKRDERFRLVVGDMETAERFDWNDDAGPLEVTALTATGKHRGIPEEYALLQNYPNPFNPETTIELALPEAGEWQIEIYNILGRRVREYHGFDEAGYVKVTWNASNCASGVYFYRAQAKGFRESKKMLLVK